MKITRRQVVDIEGMDMRATELIVNLGLNCTAEQVDRLLVQCGAMPGVALTSWESVQALAREIHATRAVIPTKPTLRKEETK